MNRRNLLAGAAAVAAVPATVAIAAASQSDPLLALGVQWEDACRRLDAEAEFGQAIYDKLPECAKGGWPRIDRTLALFREFPPISEDNRFHWDRVSLAELK